ncbi:dihydropteroate synthase [Ammoniphilus sp. 3BR4]|uniref:dihydropteroate synthase n=1 Tax=Ammoniphilus sp. 3BR4 TaxID=3158265 RepID=UPI003466C724
MLTTAFQSRIPHLREKTLVMGILNVTPDSFSDGGSYITPEQAMAHARKLVQDGADILDIGGESTRPGFIPVSAEEEIERVVPIIEMIKKEIDIPISVDTYKAEVADRAVLAGADIINDIWGAKADPRMAEVAARHQVPIILMHNRNNKNYSHLINDMIADIMESIEIVRSAGVQDEAIWIDPGIGFAKTYEDNLQVMANLERFVALGYPVLLGTSRKSMIGTALDLPLEERLEGSLATVCYGVQKGCHVVRVHDVKETVRACQMMDKMIQREGANNG